MGRQQHLERLVYGRSAFEELRPEDLAQFLERTADDHDETAQQYDAKGRPTNPRSEQFDTDLRHAQNEVLALVGAIERRNAAEAESAELRANAHHNAVQDMVRREDACGEKLYSRARLCGGLVSWGSDVLLARVLVGLYPLETSFWQILTTELAVRPGAAWYATALGLVLGSTIVSTQRTFHDLIVLIVRPLMRRVHASPEVDGVHGHQAIMRTVAHVLGPAIDVAAGMLLLPVSIYGCAIVLGLAPACFAHPLPSWRVLSSFSGYVYKGSYASITRFYASPAIPLLCLTAFERYGSVVPRGASGTSITHGPYRHAHFTAFGFSTYAKYLETALWPGPAAMNKRTASRRVTRLALLPVTWFGQHLCSTLDKLIMLPVEALFLHRSAIMYIDSGLPLSTAGLAFAARQSTNRLVGWHDYRNYLSAVGLALATKVILQGVVFGAVWAVVRWQGMRDYGWKIANNQCAVTTFGDHSPAQSDARNAGVISAEEAMLESPGHVR
ncbi:hypothetical protein B0A48_07256 [Cryoendolithus antarcticus]|uniref:Uncharacterized protein n=1 Tax=Cryoendolithus antarcticus TaxID=1507870 RepID=A0A1V8T8A0_9PEZI|nr:hypothetical protein B0A48_07256 [Cryoendolithus antarcticus]